MGGKPRFQFRVLAGWDIVGCDALFDCDENFSKEFEVPRIHVEDCDYVSSKKEIYFVKKIGFRILRDGQIPQHIGGYDNLMIPMII